MDNFTHTLAGMAAAEAALQLRRVSGRTVSGSWRAAAYVTSLVASNIPDLDLLLSPLTKGKLGYLLHHRGHTHTLAVVPVMALLVLAFIRWRAKRNVWLWSREDWLWLVGLAMLGPLLHVGLDALNTYGVHPYWPFDNRWRYGDSLFILEPWLWLSLIPVLLPLLRTIGWRLFWRSFAVVALLLVWGSGMVPPLMMAIVTLWAGLLFAAARRLSPGRLVATGILAFTAVVAVFTVTQSVARRRAEGYLSAQFPTSRTLDIALSPGPANPLCWRMIAVQVDETAGTFFLRDGTLAPWPGVLTAAACPSRFVPEVSAPLTPLSTPDAGLVWRGAFAAPLAQFRELAQGHCQVAAFLQFARAPFYLMEPVSVFLGDLRFDREVGEGFAEMTVPRVPDGCPGYLPPWEPPLRAALGM